MIDDLRAIAIFAETIEQGSFRKAATTLKLSPSVVSYHISQLEERLNTTLIYRSTRKLSLTHEGEILYQHAKDMLDSAKRGLNIIGTTTTMATGKLTLTIPSGLARSPINQKVSQFSKLNPGIEMVIHYTDSRLDLIEKGIDVALRAGSLQDSVLKSKSLGQIERKMVCSPELYIKHNRPDTPSALTGINWIRLSMLGEHRVIYKKGEAPYKIQFSSNICVDSVDAMTQLTLNGLGISTPPDFLVEDEINAGNLVELCSDWTVQAVPLHAVWPGNVSDNSNTRRLLNFLFSDTQEEQL